MRKCYKFTIIIPTYNCAKYLSKALNSLISQGELFGECQVLIIDDGSQDNTHALCQNYCQLHPQNIFYTKKPNANGGSVINYVKINRLARGDLITVLDADDWYEPAMLTKVARYTDKDMIVTDFYCFNKKGKRKKVAVYFSQFTHDPLFSNKLKLRTPHSQPIGKFYSKRVFYLLRDLQENRGYQDCIMYHMGVGIAKEIQYINQPLATGNNQRENNSTTTVGSNNQKFNDWCNVIKSMDKHGAGLATYIYASLPGFVTELKSRNKTIILPHKAQNNGMPKLLGFFLIAGIHLKIGKYVKNAVK